MRLHQDHHLTIGADPEFELCLRNSDSLLPADDVLSDRDHHKVIGLDGCSSTGELRPDYAESPHDLVENVRELILRFHKEHSGYSMKAGGGLRNSLGGHIHFNVCKLSRRQVDALDAMVSVPYNRLCNMELRRGDGYGRLSDVRSQYHGVEYRSPSSWLCDPVIAEALLTMAWCCVLYSKAVETWLDGRGSPSYTHIMEFTKAELPKKYRGVIVAGYNRMREMFNNQECAEDVDILAAWEKEE